MIESISHILEEPSERPSDEGWKKATPRELDPPLAGSSDEVCSDDRKHRTNSDFPERACASLTLYFRPPAGGVVVTAGSACFISPRSLVTAGHVIYDHANGGWPQRVEISVARDGSSMPWGTPVYPWKLNVPKAWSQDQNRLFDIGVIQMSHGNIGTQTGYLEIIPIEDRYLKGAALKSAGYPGDKFGADGPTMWGEDAYSAGIIADNWFSFGSFNAKGASGSPVWLPNWSKPVLAGVFVRGTCPNEATKINSVFAQYLKSLL